MVWPFLRRKKLKRTEITTNGDLLSDRAKLIAINDHLLSDQVKIRAINAHLLRDQEFIKGTVEMHERERAWYEEKLAQFEAKFVAASSAETKQRPGGILSRPDMEALFELAKTVPDGGTIIDVGSLLGLSTSFWCDYSKARRIVCIDPWVYHPWMKEFCEKYGPVSREAFLANVRDPRVETIVGFSPDCAGDWSSPVDLYWEDGDHGDPVCTKGILFWSSHVRLGGIACGHDYHWPDVKRQADALAVRWNSEVKLKGAVWSVRRRV